MNYQGLNPSLNVLDHGFVVLCNIAGPTRRPLARWDASDRDPAQAARMSFDKGLDEERPREQDLKLCDYLMKNWHNTPFEMVEIWLEMKLPIFVARQFVRHRTVSINEVSGRYITLPAEWYIPEVVGGKALSAKQGQEDNLDEKLQDRFRRALDAQAGASYAEYFYWMSQGVAPEHARLFLHLNHYTHWLWKQDFHNMMHFLSLRDHSHAQLEAQVYARAADTLIRTVLPESMALYDKYRKQA